MSSVIEVPDWYRTVALVGVDDAGDPVVVLLDSTGAIMAVMKGEYAGTLKNIAVDASGRIVSVIRDPTSDNYIAIDANGYIAAVLKATYSGVLKDVACDAEGRIIMIPTDPADVWGNAISMGNAELSARINQVFAHDYRGSILFLEDFAEGIQRWTADAVTTGASVALSAALSRYGSYACKLTAGSDGTLEAGIATALSYPIPGKFGLQVAFSLAQYTEKVRLDLFIYDGTNQWQGRVAYDYDDNKILYQDSAGVMQTLASGIDPYRLDQAFHVLKFVVDGVGHKYVRLMLAGIEYDMSLFDMRSTVDATAPHIIIQICHLGTSGQNPVIYVDGVVVTQNEPANA